MQRQQRSPWHEVDRGAGSSTVLLTRARGASWDVTSRETEAKNSTSVPSSAFPASSLMETGERSSSLGTKPGHALCKSSWPLSKQKGLAQGLWLGAGAAGGQQVLHSFAMASASSKGVTLGLPHSPGLGAQTPLLIPSASPGKPNTWKTQLLSFTDDQDLPTANEPAVLGAMTVPTPGSCTRL